jgi:putative acetyltransferase
VYSTKTVTISTISSYFHTNNLLYKACFVHIEPLEAWKSRFKDDLAKHNIVWVAELQSRIVGFIVLNGKERTLEQLFVDVNVQRIGIGTALLNKAKTICPLGLSLTTLQQNVQARKFYKKHGFVAGKLGINPVNSQESIEYTWIPIS